MFAAYFAYQLIDLALALLVIVAVDRRVGGRASLRATLTRTVPLASALLLFLAVVCAVWLHQWVGWIAWESLGAKWSVRFRGVGAAYWGGVLLLPSLSALRAWRGGGAATLARVGTLAWLVASLLLLFEMSWRAPRALVVERRDVVLQEWPPDAPPLRIAVIADVQSPRLSNYERDLIARVTQLQPDLIVLPGDLVSQSFDDAQSIACARFVLDGATARLGTFAVNGDIDPLVEGGIAAIVSGTRARLLANDSVLLDVGFPLELTGLDADDPAAFAATAHAAPRAEIRIALVHKPEHVTTLGPAGFDLVVAGHTHGGQIVVPGIGPLVTLSPLPDEVDGGGLHAIAGTQLYVSRGIGCESGFAPPMRLFCPPELTLLTLRGPTTR